MNTEPSPVDMSEKRRLQQMLKPPILCKEIQERVIISASEYKPLDWVCEYVFSYLQIFRCRVAVHKKHPAVDESIFPDVPHAHRNVHGRGPNMGKVICAYLGNPVFKDDFLNIICVEIPR